MPTAVCSDTLAAAPEGNEGAKQSPKFTGRLSLWTRYMLIHR